MFAFNNMQSRRLVANESSEVSEWEVLLGTAEEKGQREVQAIEPGLQVLKIFLDV